MVPLRISAFGASQYSEDTEFNVSKCPKADMGQEPARILFDPVHWMIYGNVDNR